MSAVPPPLADLELRDRAALVDDALVLADLHLGQGTAAGLEVPVGDGARTVDRLRDLLAWADPDRLVLAGDVLHSFRTVPRTVRDAIAAIQAAAETHGVDVVALEGNHDTMLEAVWDGPVGRSCRIGETVVCHGHELPEADASRYVVGHDHPVLTVAGRRRPCYLAGAGVYEGADVVVLPAFSRLLRGVAVNDLEADEFMSPLLRETESLAPVVWDADARETVAFPPLSRLRERL